MKLRNSLLWVLALLVAFCMVFTGCNSNSNANAGDDTDDFIQTLESIDDATDEEEKETLSTEETTDTVVTNKPLTLADIKPFSGTPYVVINGNQPDFVESEITTQSYEFYSPLDSLGRCGYAMASLSLDTMPAPGEDRGDISKIKPTGWINNKYDSSIVPTGWIYNRSHLIGWQLSAENANNQNLITGTQYLNQKGMLPFENMIAAYIKDTDGNHVMYRVTPMYDGNNLVASGVHLEAYSVEDEGEGICINVFIYNVQEGVTIDYATGENKLTNPPVEEDNNHNSGTVNGGESAGDNVGDNGGENVGDSDNNGESSTYYILNTNSKKIHYPDCDSVGRMSEKNKEEYSGSISDKIAEGYTTCGTCNPQ